MCACFHVGLYKQGLLHDLSKYSPVEFRAGCKDYAGDRSPNNVQRMEEGCSTAWLHHKGRNKHHFEYWVDYNVDRDAPYPLQGMKMPVRYVVEMFCDRVSACKVYQKENYTDRSPLEYYLRSKKRLAPIIHPETAALLETMLRVLAEKGEKEAYSYIRTQVLGKKK